MTGLQLLLGVDLGTSGLKAVAVDLRGDVVGQCQVGYPTSRPEPGAAEQDPSQWLTALASALADLRSQLPTAQWLSLGLSGMIPTLVTTNADGEPVGPALTWEDARAEAQGAALRQAVGSDWLYERTGQWLDGRYLLPMWERIVEVDPTRADNTAWLLGARDYIYWWLTGVRFTDPSTATGFGCFGLASGEWLADVLAVTALRTGRTLPQLPQVRATTQQSPLSPRAAAMLDLPVGLPVVLGSADSVSAALALGVTSPGEVAYVAGTSTVILGVSDHLHVDPSHRYLVTPLALGDGWGLEMDLLTTGSALTWLADLFGITAPEIVELGLVVDPMDVPVFLPYLAPGEQGALWDPELTGTLSGLGLHHGRAEISAALVVGLVLESRRCLDVLAEVAGGSGPIRIAGSSASDLSFQRALASSTGRTVTSTSVTEHSARGAAMVAAASLGLVLEPIAVEELVISPGDRVPWDLATARHNRTLSQVQSFANAVPSRERER